MIINPANNLKTVSIFLGSLAADVTIPVASLAKKARIVAVRLMNGANITGADNTHVALKLKNGSTEIATLDTDPDLQGSLTKNEALAFDLDSDESLLSAGTDLTCQYDETEYAGLPEITDVLCVGDTAGSLDQKTFIVSDDSGTVGFWIDLDNAGGSAPAAALACARQVKIATVTTGMTAAQVAGVIATAVDAQAKFIAAVVTSTTVRITDVSVGTRTNGSASTSGFTVSVNQNGTAADAAIALTSAQLCIDFYPL